MMFSRVCSQWLTSGSLLYLWKFESIKLPEFTKQHVSTEDDEEIKADYVVTVSRPVDLTGQTEGFGQLGPCFTWFLGFLWFSCTWYTARNMSSVSIPPPQCLQKPLSVPHRHMFGPGPSNVPPRILEAGANPVIGHMHPEIFEVTQWI